MKKMNKILTLIIWFSILIGINSFILNENNLNLKVEQNNQNLELYLGEPTPPTIVEVSFNEIDKSLYYNISISESSNIPTILTSIQVTNGIQTYVEISIKDGPIPLNGEIILNDWNSDRDYSDVFFKVIYNYNYSIISDITISQILEIKNNDIILILILILMLILIFFLIIYYIFKKNKTKENTLIE